MGLGTASSRFTRGEQTFIPSFSSQQIRPFSVMRRSIVRVKAYYATTRRYIVADNDEIHVSIKNKIKSVGRRGLKDGAFPIFNELA